LVLGEPPQLLAYPSKVEVESQLLQGQRTLRKRKYTLLHTVKKPCQELSQNTLLNTVKSHTRICHIPIWTTWAHTPNEIKLGLFLLPHFFSSISPSSTVYRNLTGFFTVEDEFTRLKAESALLQHEHQLLQKDPTSWVKGTVARDF
jgi:hypothetical protein